MNEIKLFNVVGTDDLVGITFARCTTYEKAKKAKELIESVGFEDMLDIEKDELSVDMIEIDGKIIEL